MRSKGVRVMLERIKKLERRGVGGDKALCNDARDNSTLSVEVSRKEELLFVREVAVTIRTHRLTQLSVLMVHLCLFRNCLVPIDYSCLSHRCLYSLQAQTH